MMYAGLDIGGTKCAVVLGDESGNIIEKIKFPTGAPQKTIDRFIEILRSFNDFEAIGISCGGPLDGERGLILSPPNLIGWDNIHITEILEKEFKVSAFLQNDADACALAEWKFGAGQKCKNMIFLTFGTGMGAGLILNGQLYSGSCGAAGEVGHIRMERFGPVGYGKQGSFEGFCSGGGIAQTARSEALRIMQTGAKVSYCESVDEIGNITAETVANAAKAGKSDAVRVYERCGEMLGRGLAVLIDILNPEKIVIGSIYARCEELLREKVMEIISSECLKNSAEICKIVPAALGEKIGDIAALTVAINGLEIMKCKSF